MHGISKFLLFSFKLIEEILKFNCTKWFKQHWAISTLPQCIHVFVCKLPLATTWNSIKHEKFKGIYGIQIKTLILRTCSTLINKRNSFSKLLLNLMTHRGNDKIPIMLKWLYNELYSLRFCRTVFIVKTFLYFYFKVIYKYDIIIVLQLMY